MRQFSDISAFLRHMAVIAAKASLTEATALRDAGRIIQADAQARLGHYQDAAGPFPPWEELAEITKEERARLGYAPNDPLLRSGTLREHIELQFDGKEAAVGVPDVEVGDGSPENEFRNIGEIAMAMELGGHSPPRPFLGPAAFEKGHAAVAQMAVVLTDAVAGQRYNSAPTKEQDQIPF